MTIQSGANIASLPVDVLRIILRDEVRTISRLNELAKVSFQFYAATSSDDFWCNIAEDTGSWIDTNSAELRRLHDCKGAAKHNALHLRRLRYEKKADQKRLAISKHNFLLRYVKVAYLTEGILEASIFTFAILYGKKLDETSTSSHRISVHLMFLPLWICTLCVGVLTALPHLPHTKNFYALPLVTLLMDLHNYHYYVVVQKTVVALFFFCAASLYCWWLDKMPLSVTTFSLIGMLVCASFAIFGPIDQDERPRQSKSSKMYFVFILAQYAIFLAVYGLTEDGIISRPLGYHASFGFVGSAAFSFLAFFLPCFTGSGKMTANYQPAIYLGLFFVVNLPLTLWMLLYYLKLTGIFVL